MKVTDKLEESKKKWSSHPNSSSMCHQNTGRCTQITTQRQKDEQRPSRSEPDGQNSSHHKSLQHSNKVICGVSRWRECGWNDPSPFCQLERPSQLHRTSESQINRPDTSNDSAWKPRYGSAHSHMRFKKKKKQHSRWVSQTITPRPMTGTILIGVFVSSTGLSLWGSPVIFSFFSEEVIATQVPGICGESGILIERCVFHSKSGLSEITEVPCHRRETSGCLHVLLNPI